ncbi:TPA: addiction module toxin RelE [Candidatus Woesearchaeota archaeon]|nr:addiction module toxin RelE [archaeon]HIJ10659.1 addiction module toxin RelE [Candidatus Woesearchaeota archaeon]|tara:strand:- start:55 stop:336 length:282 start_codon:yes stop_codon:yes gene_type:complete
MYRLKVMPEADKIFFKLSKKNQTQLKIIYKKVTEIQKDPYGYKFLRKPLHGFNRVHIDRSFVLVFTIDHQEELVTVHYFDHHDVVYKWQPKNI